MTTSAAGSQSPSTSSLDARKRLASHIHEGLPTAPVELIRAFAEVPREWFVRQVHPTIDAAPVRRPVNAPGHAWEEWLERVYADEALITQIGPDGLPSSSSTAPSVMAAMLEVLEVHPGHRVLELGTGTGYNAAVLAALVGPAGTVTTVEIHPELAAQASAVLSSTQYGRRVMVEVGDGRSGTGMVGAFDRIIYTASDWTVRPAIFDRLRGDGLLVMNLRGDLASALLVLSKRNDGTGIGRLLEFGRSRFMALRPEADTAASTGPRILPRTGFATLAPIDAADLTSSSFGMWCQLRMPDLRPLPVRIPEVGLVTYFTTAEHGAFSLRSTGEGSLVEVGEDDHAWVAVLGLWSRWVDQGRPGLDRLQLKITDGAMQLGVLATPDDDMTISVSSIPWWTADHR